MRVQLAYPWEDVNGNSHDPDDVVEVEDLQGRTMVREGVARLPDADQLTVDDLRQQARDRGLDVKSLRSRAQLEEALGVAPAVGGPTTNTGGDA